MNETQGITRHAIAYLRVLGNQGEDKRQASVECPRQGGSVSLDRCARCPRFVKVTPGGAPGEEAVHCHAGTVDDCAESPLMLPRVSVSAVMTRNVLSVRPDLTLDAVSCVFLETELTALPVVDEHERLLGFIGQDEVTLAVQVGDRRSGQTLTVADVLMPLALAVPESTSVSQAAAVMAFEGQQRLAVTSSGGAVVGVLSASDILYWLARSDGHLIPRPRSSCRP